MNLFPVRERAEGSDPEQQPGVQADGGELQAADRQQPVQRGRHGRHQGLQAGHGVSVWCLLSRKWKCKLVQSGK